MDPFKSPLIAILLSIFTCSVVSAEKTPYRRIDVKKIVNARDPYESTSLRNAHTVRSQNYDEYDDFSLIFSSEIRYIDRDNNKSTIERVKITTGLGESANYCFDARDKFSLPVRSLNDYTIYLAGDDDKIVRALGTTHIVMGNKDCDREENRYIFRDDMVKDLLAFAKSPINKAFPVKQVEMVIYPHRKGYFDMLIPDTAWIKKTGSANTDYGKKVFGQGSVRTKNGLYIVTFYSTDGNPGKYENVVIKRNDGLRCRVDELREIVLIFKTDEGDIDKATVKCINISDPILGRFTIIDDVMYDSLMTLKDDTVNNNAIEFTKNNCHLMIDESGIYYYDTTSTGLFGYETTNPILSVIEIPVK